jgi:hypothetical protein
MTAVADLVVRDAEDRTIAVVEAKNARDLTPEWATEVLEHLVARIHLNGVCYRLVASQDYGYLWDNAAENGADAQPSARFDMRPIVAKYSGLDPENGRLRHNELQLTLFAWLLDVTLGSGSDWSPPDASEELYSFLRDIRGGTVGIEERV